MAEPGEAALEPGYEFWHLLAILEEITTASAREGSADRALARDRLSRFLPDERDAVLSTLEVMIVGLDFIRALLRRMRAARLSPRRLARPRRMPTTVKELHERLRVIAAAREGHDTQRARGSEPGTPDSTGAADAQRAVRSVLGILETAVATMDRKVAVSMRAITARLDSPGRHEIAQLMRGALLVEAAIGALLTVLESEIDRPGQ
ncbi:MAG TPA: hypothetical protein VGB83_12495 [Actinomycetota bacterium]